MAVAVKLLWLLAIGSLATLLAEGVVRSDSSSAGSSVSSASDDHSRSLKEIVAGLQRHYRETKSFSARFTEEIDGVGSPKRTRAGVVYFQRPGRMRWEFEVPNKELVVSDGEVLYSYDPDLNQVVEAPLKESLRSPGATEFLLGAGDIERDFRASADQNWSNDDRVHVKLIPKKGGNTVELSLDPGSYNITAIRVTDQLGNVTVLKFTELRNNSPIKDSLFAFVPPPGADVVHSGPNH